MTTEKIAFWSLMGRVTTLAEKKTYALGGGQFVGVRVGVEAQDTEKVTWSGTIEIPIGYIPAGLTVGSTIRLTAEVVEFVDEEETDDENEDG